MLKAIQSYSLYKIEKDKRTQLTSNNKKVFPNVQSEARSDKETAIIRQSNDHSSGRGTEWVDDDNAFTSKSHEVYFNDDLRV
jgi:hypothetical protein